MILKPFLRHFEIQTATSSRIGCEFDFDAYIIRGGGHAVTDITGMQKQGHVWGK